MTDAISPVVPVVLPSYDPELIRVGFEVGLFRQIEADPSFAQLQDRLEPADAGAIRRRLMGSALRLSDSMAPEVFATAHAAMRTLGIEKTLEIYQSSGRENAAIHLIDEPIVVEIQGRLLGLLDPGAALAVMGHELGHYLAHGPRSAMGRGACLAAGLAGAERVPARLQGLASRLSMAMELTADRFGLLACQDLHAVLRLEMVATTGLPGDSLTWDTRAYLAQCRDLMEATLAGGEKAQGSSHPEHNLRTWAAWLFSESDVYRQLTGQGPGTRTLAAIDALLAKVIGQDDADLTWHMYDDPPRELHECALACGVLVALADGEMAEPEAEALEKVFAPLLSDWRWYLSRDNALEKFSEVGGYVMATGPEAQRALFNLLIHVVISDGAARHAELEMIVAIGDALGCGALYRKLLLPTLQALGLEAPDLAVVSVSLPLPPRPGEAEASLQAFLHGMLRRGGGKVTLRRLLRLLGQAALSEAALQLIKMALQKHGLQTDADLAEASLDQPIELSGTKPLAARAAQADTSPVKARLLRALGRLRDELISGDGRSRSVRLHSPRPGRAFDVASLEAVSVGLAERVLAQLRAGQRARLVDASEAGRHDAARKLASDLIELDRESRGLLEETGASDLYLGYPFLSGVVQGYVFRAPLVLFPLQLERDDRGARSLAGVPRKDKEPAVNQALLRLLFHKQQLAFPDELAGQLDEIAADQGPEAVLGELARLGVPTTALSGQLTPLRDRSEEFAAWVGTRFQVEECAVLGLFPQSGSDLLQDYEGLLQELNAQGAPLGLLLGCALDLLPADVRASLDQRPPEIPPSDQPVVPVLHADPSQRRVMQRARSASTLVVDGPPGTGKSQVIVNLVADALGRGERVAVVSEKRAALDVVVQRLEGAGLRHVLALVHDVQADRKQLYAQIAARLEAQDTPAGDPGQAALLQIQMSGVLQKLSDRHTALASRPQGLAISTGQLHALAAGLSGVDLPDTAALSSLNEGQLTSLEAGLLALRPAADLLAPSSPWMAPGGKGRRPSFASWSEAQVREFSQALRHAATTARELRDLTQQSPQPLADLQPAAAALQAVRASRPQRSDPSDPPMLAGLLRAAQSDPSGLSLAVRAEGEWLAVREAALRLGVRWVAEAPAGTEAALALLTAQLGRFFRWLLPSWWSARGAVRQALGQLWPEQAGAALDAALLGQLRDRLQAAKGWRALEQALDRLDMRTWLENSAQAADELAARLARLARLGSALLQAKPQLEKAGAWPQLGQDLGAWDTAVDQRLAVLDAAQRHQQAIAAVQKALPWLAEWTPAENLLALQQSFDLDAPRLLETDRLVAAAEQVHPVAWPCAVALAAQVGMADAPTWRDTLTRAWALAWLARLEREHAELVHLDTPGPDVAAMEGQLADLVRRAAELERHRVLARLDDSLLLRAGVAEKGKRRSADQAVREQMHKESKKQRNLLPLRSFVRRFADDGLLELMPVWLLSPETMAVLFPRQPLFDLVIFDEASQCTVESGLPVLLRARRVVIAGDDKQMPPTAFFEAQDGQEDLEPERQEDRQDGRRDLLDEESLLTLARARSERAPLQWHYRCREEELIAFSNHAMYQGSLLTIPSTSTHHAQPSLRWIGVPDGKYEAGRNPIEARRVVDELHALLLRPQVPSVGVVTFNTQQRKAILDEIDRRKQEDADFQARWDKALAAERMDERPFVKNLENVQGDERDVIIFSLGHAPIERHVAGKGKQPYVPSRFGPLGLRGGERRLNVAVSRARAECVLVASFEPHMLSVAATKNEGPKLFKAFLEFAHHMAHSRRPQAERVLTLVREGAVAPRKLAKVPLAGYVPVRAQLAEALEKRGLRCEMDVGTSHFRVPLAVIDPRDPGRYALALFCDEGDDGAETFDRHVQRPLALHARGWKVLRLHAREWQRKPEATLQRVLAALGPAVGP